MMHALINEWSGHWPAFWCLWAIFILLMIFLHRDYFQKFILRIRIELKQEADIYHWAFQRKTFTHDDFMLVCKTEGIRNPQELLNEMLNIGFVDEKSRACDVIWYEVFHA